MAPSTAHSSRPYTARPTTTTTSGGFTYDDDDESSDGEDVFAFLPPTTADGQGGPSTNSPTSSQPFAQFGHSPHTPSPAFPPATFDPHARYTTDSGTGPSASYYPYQAQNAGSPPSAESYSHQGTNEHEHYKMRALHPVTTGETRMSQASFASDGRASLPSGKELLSDEESRPRGKRRPSSITQSETSPSMLERDGSIKMDFDFDAMSDDEDSPFPEVRASVSNIDDVGIPAMTGRMWVIGLLLCMTSSAMNVFFSLRQPAPTIFPIILLLLAYPIGKGCALLLPIRTWRLPKWLGSVECSMNPGPWNIKEHVLVFIMANVAVSPPYAMNAVIAGEKFYNIKFDYWFNLTLVLATQLTGFGLAGLCRRFLVKPASMVWPQNLVICALLNTLHADEDEEQGGITRYRFFMYTMFGAFLFFLLPGFLFQALSTFSFVCWIWPKNKVVNTLFGVSSGLGMSLLTFDWTQITWIGSPLIVPWWAEVHIAVGFVLFYWLITPLLWFTNAWYIGYFPINGVQPYDRFGELYDVSKVLDARQTFNFTAYEEYSPLYLTAPYAITYLIAFALSTCLLVHTGLYHGRSLYDGIRRVNTETPDIHQKLMARYPEVPDFWYLISFCVFFSLGIVAITVWPTGMPVGALFLAVLLPIVYILPTGFIYAMTGQEMSLNLLAQIIPGALIPGKPMTNMIFKAYAAQTLVEGTAFIQDLKLGHYVKVPPRSVFIVQAVATILSAFVQVGVKQWLFDRVPDICEAKQASRLTCPVNKVFFSASAIWGIIGPTRQFGQGTLYEPHLYALAVGAVLPVPFWLWHRRYPKSWVKYINIPVALNGVAFIPPATGINYSAWFVVAFIFQYWIRRKHFAWWSKFNYVLSAALDGGTLICVLFIFLAFQLSPGGGTRVKWWGNEVYKTTLDYDPQPLFAIPEGGIPKY